MEIENLHRFEAEIQSFDKIRLEIHAFDKIRLENQWKTFFIEMLNVALEIYRQILWKFGILLKSPSLLRISRHFTENPLLYSKNLVASLKPRRFTKSLCRFFANQAPNPQ